MADLGLVVEWVAGTGALRERLDVDQAARMHWLLNHPSVYYLAIVEGQWPEEQFEQWLADVHVHQLLKERWRVAEDGSAAGGQYVPNSTT